jgi:prepilin-type N-terminal cleavage/methylation domain-containing protein
MHKYKKGFTIIELIVVIAIIAILAAIVIINITAYIQKAKVAAINATLDQISKAAAAYYATNGSYAGFCGTNSDCGAAENDGSPDFQKFCNALANLLGPGGKSSCWDSNNFTDSTSTSNVVCAPSEWEWVAEIPPGGHTSLLPCIDSTGSKGSGTTNRACTCGPNQGSW